MANSVTQAQYRFLALWCQHKAVLVAGCGAGQGPLLLAQAGATWIDAMDPDAAAIAQAKQTCAHPVIAYHPKAADTMDISRLYDRAIYLNLLDEHTDPEPIIRYLAQLLTEEGSLALAFTRNPADGRGLQDVRAMVTPYFQCPLHVYYVNTHVAVSVTDGPTTPPDVLWNAEQLDVNTCDTLLLVAYKRANATPHLPCKPVVALDTAQALHALHHTNQQLQQQLAEHHQATTPLRHQLNAAYQAQEERKLALMDADDCLRQRDATIQQLNRQLAPLKKYQRSPWLRLHQNTRWGVLRVRKELRHLLKGPKLIKPDLPQQLTWPWAKGKFNKKSTLTHTLSWLTAPIETLLDPDWEHIKAQAARKPLKAGFNKVLVLYDHEVIDKTTGQAQPSPPMRWQCLEEAATNHGLTMGVLPLRTVTTAANATETLAPWLDADAVILYEVAMYPHVQTLINTFKNRNTPIIADAEHATSDPTAMAQDEAIQAQDLFHREAVLARAERERMTLEAVHYQLVSSTSLAEQLAVENGTPCVAWPTPFTYAQRVLASQFKNPQRFLPSTQATRLWVQLDENAARPQAFLQIESALHKLLLRYPNVVITINGQWQGAERLKPFTDRLRRVTTPNPLECMRLLAQQDILLLPLHPHCTATGCAANAAYWVRLAALVRVPTVATTVGSLVPLILPGINGEFADHEQEWVANVSHLIENANVRELQADNAKVDALRHSYVENVLPQWMGIMERLLMTHQHEHPSPFATTLQAGGTAPAMVPQHMSVAVAFTVHTLHPPLRLEAVARIRTLMGMGYYITLLCHTTLHFATVTEALEPELGPAAGRYALMRLTDAINPHEVCLALDWQAAEAARPVQHRFGVCLRWLDEWDCDHTPMTLQRLRMETLYREGLWQHATSSPWLQHQLTQTYGTPCHTVAPWVVPQSQPAEQNGQRVLVHIDATRPDALTDWLIEQLTRISQLHPTWTLHLMGQFDPKPLPFACDCSPLPTSVDELVNWLQTGNLLIAPSLGAPLPLVYQAMACGLPVIDVQVPGREDRYPVDCPVTLLPMAGFANACGDLIVGHHYRLNQGALSQQFAMGNATPLDSQLQQLLALAKQQLNRQQSHHPNKAMATQPVW
jgi:hypothetical protein